MVFWHGFWLGFLLGYWLVFLVGNCPGKPLGSHYIARPFYRQGGIAGVAGVAWGEGGSSTGLIHRGRRLEQGFHGRGSCAGLNLLAVVAHVVVIIAPVRRMSPL